MSAQRPRPAPRTSSRAAERLPGGGRDPRGTTASAGHPFDAVAPGYDREFSERLLGRWLRRRVWERLAEHLPRDGRILDLGCGTGEDTRWLARRGAHVTAVDAAPLMLERARAKLEHEGLTPRVRLVRCDLADPAGLAGLDDPPERFDGAVSDFGALNCLADRRPLGATLARLLRPGARAVVVAMGPFCLWETAAALAAGRCRAAFRRSRHGAPADIGAGAALPIWYPSPRRLSREWGGPLRLRHVEPLGLLLPPTPYADLVERHRSLFAGLERLERRLAGFAPAAWAADHYLCVFEKRSPAV